MPRSPIAAVGFMLTLVLVLISGCPEPTDRSPDVPISPGVAGRIALMPGRGGKAVTPAPSAPGRAYARPFEAKDALGGPSASGKIGDWVLSNDAVVFVIDGLGGGGGFAESGGNVIDAADARARKDELGKVLTSFGTFPRQAVYRAIEGRDAANGVAVIVARGVELRDPSIEVETTYQLSPNDRAILVRTTLTNTGPTPVSFAALGDTVHWGSSEKVAPGKAVGFQGPSSGPYLGGIGRFTSYALTSTEGAIDATSGRPWSNTQQLKNVTIAPRASASYERVLAVGERGDAASIVATLTKASGEDVARVEIALVDEKGKPVPSSVGGKVLVATPRGDEVMSIVADRDGDATFGGDLPLGKWLVSYAPSAGRLALLASRTPLEVRAGTVARATLGVSAASKMSVVCTEGGGASDVNEVPCKATIEGLAGTPTPDFGAAHRAGPARNQLIAARGDVALPPGKYRLTVTRGPEYGAETSELTLAPGETRALRFPLRRVVDTAGYVAADFHQHTSASGDAGTGAIDRVLSNVVEGVEVAVASEHNLVIDLSNAVRATRLTTRFVSIPGVELTTDATMSPWGHANAFPLVPDLQRPRGGAPDVRDRSASEVFKDVRARPGGARVVSINHPRAGSIGYFDLTGFDPATGTGSAPGYDASFDALEVWNGLDVDARAKVLNDYLALLRTGHPVTPIAASDTHGIVGYEPGLPRTYVAVARDGAFETWSRAETEDLVSAVRTRRDVVLSNGPFVRVTANGGGIGSLVVPRAGGRVDVSVDVRSAPFAKSERAEIFLVRANRVSGWRSISLRPRVDDASGFAASGAATLQVREDDAFVVVVRGDKPMRPMLAGTDVQLLPWAMSAAIWIDADGDGEALGRRR